MRILAASFMTEGAAEIALKQLDGRFGAAGALRMAPLGRASNPRGPTSVLAGCFADEVVVAVRRAVEDLGGTVVVDVDEARTHAR